VAVEHARIHPSAVVDPSAEIAVGVQVDPFVVIEAGVRVDSGARIRTGSVLQRGTHVMSGAKIGPYAIIGSEPPDRNYRGESSGVEIGPDADIREHVVVSRATGAGERTRIGAGSLVMTGAHVSHNCQIGARVTLVTLVQLGGHVEIGDDAVLGSGAMVHQWVRIGRGAMVGAMSGLNMDVLPFALARGAPARHYRLNALGLKRLGFAGDRYRALESGLRACRGRDQTALGELASHWPEVAEMRDFIADSRRGIARFRA
jgi:UDP-N-acetylglucosamine acyltransferase